MKKKRFAEEQIINVLKEHEAGSSVDDIVGVMVWEITPLAYKHVA